MKANAYTEQVSYRKEENTQLSNIKSPSAGIMVEQIASMVVKQPE